MTADDDLYPFIYEGKRDITPLVHYICSAARKIGVSHNASQRSDDETLRLKAATIDLIGRLLGAGLVVISFADDRWQQWSGRSTSDITARIRAEWDAMAGDPNIADICWLAHREYWDRMDRR